ncbi:methyltransferase [Pseudomonas sp. Os17]|uniref:Class I SAM-dependent methyltransferase n=1 Tax=Pseudomonas protegens TaxID=380021 RepID=A0A2T6GT36_9PSED|nr:MULTISPECIES: class I SAM-dependent methyltransferase [Pseudomonas]PUA47312.1 class I SAM-dependent methyltransferase [Pseudomonas protegens]BAQ74726.1 methyltransferase [Pseudomonas sp. Os17]
MHESARHIVDLYQRHAQAWDRARRANTQAFHSEQAWFERFRQVMGTDRQVLDLGCGGGEPVARYLVEHGYAVTGVDSSAALLDQCRQRFPEQQWINADMRGLALDQDFAGILAWNSLFHLSPDDQRAMFAVFERHAAPGCALMFTSGPAAGEAIGEFEGEALYHASLDPGEYCTLLDTHGFEVVQHISEDPQCCGFTVWLARALDYS